MMKSYIITKACCAAFHRCGLDACVRRWAVLVARRDETFKYIPLDFSVTWPGIYKPAFSQPADPLSPLTKTKTKSKKVNIFFYSSIRTLALVCRVLSSPFLLKHPHDQGGMTRSDRRVASPERHGEWQRAPPGLMSVNKHWSHTKVRTHTFAIIGALFFFFLRGGGDMISGLKADSWSPKKKKKNETRAIMEQRGGRICEDYSQ